MKKNILKFLGVLLLLALTYPLITIADSGAFIYQIPTLYIYVFVVWIVVIIAAAVVLNLKNVK